MDKINKTIRRINKLNSILEFTSSTYEKAFELYMQDVTGEFEALNAIRRNCEDLENLIMKEVTKLRHTL